MPSFPDRPAGTWRVVTWNLWWRFGADPDRRKAPIQALLAEVDADIVCLQEVYGDDTGADDAVDLGAALGLDVVRTRAVFHDGSSFGNALLSRWPILDQGERALPALDETPGHRRALWAVVGAPFGSLPVICTHLAYRYDESALRQRQAQALMELAGRLRAPDAESSPPVIVAGDLNAVPDSDELRLLTGRSPGPLRGLVFSDTWPQVRDDPGHTWVRHNPYLSDATWPQRRLDYVLVSWPRPRPLGNPVQAFLVGDGPVDGIWPSDHLGVAVDLAVAGGVSDRGREA
jgi:endonuclease/exonuclease/phosphatase family metal-dependent hydrolase